MLTDKHIEYLYLICEEHGVRYYDLQTEIVDHLAKAVEKVLEKEPSKNFFIAVEEVVASFGKNGLKKMADAHQVAISQSFHKQYHVLLRKNFSFPVIGFAAIALGILLLPFLYDWAGLGKDLLFWYGVMFFIMGSIAGISIDLMARQKRKYLYATKKKFYIQLYSICFLMPIMFKQVGVQDNIYIAAIFIALSIAILFVMHARLSVVKSFYNKAKLNYPIAFQN